MSETPPDLSRLGADLQIDPSQTKTPLIFYSAVFIVFASFLGSLAWALPPEHRLWFCILAVCVLTFIILLVTFMIIKYYRELMGRELAGRVQETAEAITEKLGNKIDELPSLVEKQITRRTDAETQS